MRGKEGESAEKERERERKWRCRIRNYPIAKPRRRNFRVYPWGGEAIMRWETQCNRSDDFQRVTSVYSFSRFFSRYSNVVGKRREGRRGRRRRGRCARHVTAETFVIRDGAGEGRVFAARRMSGVGSTLRMR